MDMALPMKSSLANRVNLRLLVLLAVISVPFLYFGYVIVNDAVTGGIRDRGDRVEVDLKRLGFFPFDPVNDTIENVPKDFRALNGKRVELVGEMWAPNEASNNVRQFELVYSIAKCCFGGPPKVQERVFVRVPDGQRVPYYRGDVRVVGTLRVDVKKDAGTAVSLYTMDVERVEPT